VCAPSCPNGCATFDAASRFHDAVFRTVRCPAEVEVRRSLPKSTTRWRFPNASADRDLLAMRALAARTARSGCAEADRKAYASASNRRRGRPDYALADFITAADAPQELDALCGGRGGAGSPPVDHLVARRTAFVENVRPNLRAHQRQLLPAAAGRAQTARGLRSSTGQRPYAALFTSEHNRIADADTL